MSDPTYVLLNTNDVSEIDDDNGTLAASLADPNIARSQLPQKNEKAFAKFVTGDDDPFLDGKTQYSHEEILETLSSSDWTDEKIAVAVLRPE